MRLSLTAVCGLGGFEMQASKNFDRINGTRDEIRPGASCSDHPGIRAGADIEVVGLEALPCFFATFNSVHRNVRT